MTLRPVLLAAALLASPAAAQDISAANIADTVRTLGLSVSFDPGTLPTRVTSGFQSVMGQPPQAPLPVPLTGTQTQAVWVDARPGVYSLMWEWD